MSEKIEIGKQYRKRDGREVDIFAIKDGRVWGRERDLAGDWVSNSWSIHNIAPYLIEVKPKITQTYWLLHNSYGRPPEVSWHKPANMRLVHPDIIAITGPHTVTFEEGEGL